MFTRRIGALAALGALALSCVPAQAGVRFSLGLNFPLCFGCCRPRPVYVAPAPVYVMPAPVYVQPAPAVYAAPAPAPVYPAPTGR
jgi:hypothetical protein